LSLGIENHRGIGMSQLVAISQIKKKKRLRKNLDDLKSLKKDIAINGLLQPIVIDTDNVLVAGLRRLKSCQQLNWKNIPCTVIDPNKVDVKSCEISENTERLDFASSDIRSIYKHVEKTRIGHRPKKAEEKGSKLPPFPKGKTHEIVSKLVGVSPTQVQKINDIGIAAEENPEKYKSLLEDVDSKKKSVNTAHQILKFDQIEFTDVKIPKGQYNVIEIDFPWAYKDAAGSKHRAESKLRYKTEPPETILQKRVPEFKKKIVKDAVIFMWVTTPLLNEIIQLKILESLGFQYKTMITWKKIIPKNIFGGNAMGHWFQTVTEHCLVGRRGDIKPFHCNLPNIIESEITKDSEKPIAFKELFEEATKNIPNRQMFEGYARRERKGWTGFGNQLQEKNAIA